MINEAVITGKGGYFNVSLYDSLYPPPVDNRSVEQITEDICARAGIYKAD